MALFKWQDIEDEARRRGIDLSARSLADQRLLQTDPDKAMRALDIWSGWEQATPEQRALDHQWMEDWRASAGYSGGGSGMGYDYTGVPAAGSFDALPAFDDKNWQTRDALLGQIAGYGEFDYDYTKDPLYAQYKKAYTREGQRSMADVLGQYSAQTGGMPSTAALNAAQQANNYYDAKIADKIPELYQQRYGEHKDRYNQLLNAMNAASGAANADWAQYLDRLGQLNTDRNFAYGQERDAVSDARYEDETAYQRAMALAQLAASYGDYSGLAGMGITPDNEALLANALAAAGRTVPVGSGGSGGGGGSGVGGSGSGSGGGTDGDGDGGKGKYGLDALFREALNSEDARVYLAQKANWKKYGLTSSDGLWDAYNNWLKNNPSEVAATLTFKSYSDAENYLDKQGLDPGEMLTEREWRQKKASGSKNPAVVDFDSYSEYLSDYVMYRLSSLK